MFFSSNFSTSKMTGNGGQSTFGQCSMRWLEFEMFQKKQNSQSVRKNINRFIIFYLKIPFPIQLVLFVAFSCQYRTKFDDCQSARLMMLLMLKMTIALSNKRNKNKFQHSTVTVKFILPVLLLFSHPPMNFLVPFFG